MKEKELEHFKNLLLGKRQKMMKHMDAIKEIEMETTLKESTGDHSAYAFHMADQGTDSMEREKNFFYAQRDGRLLYHIDRALERIENGTYGKCRSCNGPIGEARLEAVPHATLCIQCKSKEEKTAGESESPEEII
jgi:RNA polymerase-binding protein DksA